MTRTKSTVWESGDEGAFITFNLFFSTLWYLVHIHHISNTSTIIKRFSEQRATCLYDRYMTPISYLNTYRARKELKLVKSIQFRLKKSKYILRVTDKNF
jgi:hypothetical protein